jgi:hypothetical protein
VDTFKTSTQSFRFPQDWSRAVGLVREGAAEALTLEMNPLLPPAELGVAGLVWFDTAILQERHPGGHRPNTFALRRPFPIDKSRFIEVQHETVQLATTVAAKLDAAFGYITPDVAAPNANPYAAAFGLSETEVRIDRFLLGYYWGTILSSGHIAALGGLDRVEREAPCVRVETFRAASGGSLVFLQLTETIDAFSDAELRRLRDFLQPLLPAPLYVRPPSYPVRLLLDDVSPEPVEVPRRRQPEPLPPFEVAHGDGFPEGLPFTLWTFRKLTDTERAHATRVIEAFFELGMHAAFGRGFDDWSGVGAHDHGDHETLEWWADLGGNGLDVLEPLIRALTDLHETSRLPFSRLLIGECATAG